MTSHDDSASLQGAEPRQLDEKLRQSEERFRLLVESVRDYAIFMLDPDGTIVTWNRGAEQIKGYSANEILGRHFSCFYPPERVEQGWPAHELAVAKLEGRFEDEGWRVRKDGTYFWANVIITALYDDDDNRLRGFAKVTRDLSERKKVEQLEEAERRMNEFLAMLAHELRNPLAPVRNAIGILRTMSLEDAKLQWIRDVLDRQILHLAHLVDDLIDISRITRGKVELQREPLELATVVARAIESSHPLIEQRKHALQILVPDEPLRVLGDLTRLVQVVTNLLNNAAKYTPDGGRIGLSLERHEELAVLRVSDTGSGIAPELQERIFDLFMQGDRGLARTEGGLGIGLTLARRLVEMHGGSIAAHSAGAGQGSEFVVRLPLLEAPADGFPAKDEPAAYVRPAPGGPRVLVVDDNHDSTESMAVLLELWGHEVRRAYDGLEALEAAAQFRPRVVLLDIGLPGMNGYEVARQLRALPGLEDATLVAMTGYGQKEDRQRAREAGFDHHLVKPVEAPVLQELLASLAG